MEETGDNKENFCNSSGDVADILEIVSAKPRITFLATLEEI